MRLTIRLVISAAMLGILIWRLPDFDPSKLFPRWHPAIAWWLLGAAATLMVAFALQTVRWNQVLAALGHKMPFRRLFTEFLAGQFISNVLPAAVGGDIVRVSRLGKEIDDNATAFASVALERLTGWLVLPVISLVAILVTPEYLHEGNATTWAMVINVVALTALVVLLAVAANRRWYAGAQSATGWKRWLGSIHLGIDSIRAHPSSLYGAVIAGTSFQVVQCMSVWMTAQALDVPEVSLAVAFAFFPPTAIAQNLPVGFGGLGVREALFVLFFKAQGVPSERAIAIGLVGYVLMVVVSAFGAPAFALGNWKRELEEVEEELDHLVHPDHESPAERTDAP